MLQSYGIGPFRSSTFLLNQHGIDIQQLFFFAEQLKSFGKKLCTALRHGDNLSVFNVKEQEWQEMES